MADPEIKARYVLDRCTPHEIREELEKRFGARDGDVVVMLEDGSLGLGRNLDGPDTARLTHLLWPASGQASSSPLPPPSRKPRASRHLKVEK
jgi:hypothetical protein